MGITMGMVLLMTAVGRDLRGDWIDWDNLYSFDEVIERLRDAVATRLFCNVNCFTFAFVEIYCLLLPGFR